MEEEEQTLVEILNGDCLVNAPVQLKFRQKKDHEVMCRKNLTKQEVSHFQSAIEQDYYFQMYCDDLPIWGFIGWIERSLENGTHRHGLHHHFQFRIFYNKDQVIEIELRTYSNNTVLLSEGNQTYIEMLYSVDWIQTNAHFEGRMQKYLRPWHSRIHKGSVIKSSVTFLLLFSCLLIYYMRVVRTDFDNITLEESAVPVNQEQRGWKCLRSDVFRYPKYGCLLAAALGTGAQLCTLALSILLLGVMGIFYPYNRGNLWTALIVIYTITSGVSGHLAVSFYHQIGGKNWGRNLLLTGFFSFGPLFLTFSFLNTIAMTYQANAAVPLGAVMKLLLIWTSLALPLLIVGGVTGKNNHSEFQAPCETSKCPREIPPLRWHRGTLLQMVLAGFLPFSCIYIQLLHIFRGLWSFWIYTTYGTLLVIFIILLITTSLVTVALTHFQLAAEDHQWWWRSFLCGGSVGLYVYGFCFYYYLYRSDFSGFLQLSFFFGYMAWISYCIFLLCGSVGFYASLLYVRHIYSSIKSD